MVLSALLFFILASVNIAAIPLGFGLHIWNLKGTEPDGKFMLAEHELEYQFISLVLLAPCVGVAKLSIIATLLRIFTSQTCRWLRIVLQVTALFVIACCASQILFVIFQCSDVRLSWEFSQLAQYGSCSNLEQAVIASGVLNVVTDFVICCAPIPVFMKLQLPLRQRLCVSALFLSGLL